MGETVASDLLDTRIQSSLWLPRQIVSASSHQDRSIHISDASTETTRRVDFTDHSIINNEGRICGSKGEWIPPIHRSVFIAQDCRRICDLFTFLHRRSWATCINT